MEQRQTGVFFCAPMDLKIVPVEGFDVWDAVLVDRTLYVKAGADEAARTLAVLAQLQSKAARQEAPHP